MDKPTLLAEVVFLSAAEGGRHSPPSFGSSASYRPHLVVQDRAIRAARMRGSVLKEDYWGVSFVEGPTEVQCGQPVMCVLSLDYFPKIDYAPLTVGAPFTAREGVRVVAHGLVLERREGP